MIVFLRCTSGNMLTITFTDNMQRYWDIRVFASGKTLKWKSQQLKYKYFIYNDTPFYNFQTAPFALFNPVFTDCTNIWAVDLNDHILYLVFCSVFIYFFRPTCPVHYTGLGLALSVTTGNFFSDAISTTRMALSRAHPVSSWIVH